MCIYCAYTAMSSSAVATGIRSWLQSRRFDWLTAQRLHRITVGLIGAALVASSTLISGSG